MGDEEEDRFFFVLLCYERVRNGTEKQWNIYDSKQPFRQSKWGLYFAKQWPSLFPRVFHYPFVYGHADFPTLGVKTCCVCNKCELRSTLEITSSCLKESKCSISRVQHMMWESWRTFLKKLKRKKKKGSAIPVHCFMNDMWIFRLALQHCVCSY